MTGITSKSALQAIHASGLIPIFYNGDSEVAKKVLEAAYLGGSRIFEFTNRGENARKVFDVLREFSQKEFPDLMLGIGTILDGPTTERFISAGADFVVAPIMKTEMGAVCKKHDRLWIPGCGTLTEMVVATDHGADAIKMFPGAIMGPGFVSTVLPVIPGLKLIPTGGVEPTVENLGGWFKAGVYCVGMGSHLFAKKSIEAKDWAQVEENVKKTLALISSVRKNS